MSVVEHVRRNVDNTCTSIVNALQLTAQHFLFGLAASVEICDAALGQVCPVRLPVLMNIYK